MGRGNGGRVMGSRGNCSLILALLEKYPATTVQIVADAAVQQSGVLLGRSHAIGPDPITDLSFRLASRKRCCLLGRLPWRLLPFLTLCGVPLLTCDVAAFRVPLLESLVTSFLAKRWPLMSPFLARAIRVRPTRGHLERSAMATTPSGLIVHPAVLIEMAEGTTDGSTADPGATRERLQPRHHTVGDRAVTVICTFQQQKEDHPLGHREVGAVVEQLPRLSTLHVTPRHTLVNEPDLAGCLLGAARTGSIRPARAARARSVPQRFPWSGSGTP